MVFCKLWSVSSSNTTWRKLPPAQLSNESFTAVVASNKHSAVTSSVKWDVYGRRRNISFIILNKGFTKSPWAADLLSASLVVSATQQGLKHVNTCCVHQCFWDFKLLDCRTQNFVRFLVAFLGQFADIDWVRVLAQNSATEQISDNVPSIFWHHDVTNPRCLPATSIDGGPIPLVHLGVAEVREVAQSQSP
jgi:hypothetical protein